MSLLSSERGYQENLHSGVHGVKRFRADGSAEMSDGRYIALVAVSPVNTMNEDEDSKEMLAKSLGRAFDEKLKNVSADLYSTTRLPDIDDAIGEFKDRLEDSEFKNNAPGEQYRLVESLVEWYKEDDIPGWDEREWMHFAVASVSDSDIPGSAEGEELEQKKRKRLDEVVGKVEKAMSSIKGVSAHRAPPEMHIEVVNNFWSDTGPGETMRFYENSGADDVTYTERNLAPTVFDADRNGVRINGQVARTFWIADWPEEPQPLFLDNLYNMVGVDMDIKIHTTPIAKQQAINRLEKKIAKIGAVGMEKDEEGEIEAEDIKEDIQYYYDFRDLLRKSTAEAWEVSGYVTVYADNTDALEKAENTFEELESVEIAKMAALDDKADEISELLQESPAKTMPIPPRKRQEEAFIASSPLGADLYDGMTKVSKLRMVPGESIGALFPFSGERVQERGGFFWGRNQHNASQFKPDPYSRSTPHITTIGQTRSGKTYSASMAGSRWYTQSDDHQLIVADTQAGFREMTEMLGGKHIVIDGRNDINPMKIRAVSKQRRDQIGEEANPFGLKVDEVTQFVLGVLRSQSVDDVGDYAGIVKEAVVETYNKRGITQNDLSSHDKPSPKGIGELIETLEDMLRETEKYTFTDTDEEVNPRKKNIGKLLNKLGEFKEGNKYHNFMHGEGESLLGDEDMVYLDMQQMTNSSDVEKSMMLQLMLSQVSQKVKASNKKTIFMIDEAHILLHSPKMVNWLQRSAREWARYNACMWFISQSPREFVQRSEGVAQGGENSRRTILDQCSMIQFFRTPMGEDDDEQVLNKFGLNEKQQEFVKNEAVPGLADEDYTQCLVKLRDKNGWFQVHVESTPFEDDLLSNNND